MKMELIKKGTIQMNEKLPVQQTSNNEAQVDEECNKEYILASYNVRKNPISLANDEGLESNNLKITEGYHDSP